MFNPFVKVVQAAGDFSGSIVQCGNGQKYLQNITDADGTVHHAGDLIECGKQQLFDLIGTLVNFAIYIGVIAVTVTVAYAAFMMMISQGQSEKISQAKGAVTAAVIGLVITSLAWVIVNTILSVIFGCNNWNVFGGITSPCTGLQ